MAASFPLLLLCAAGLLPEQTSCARAEWADEPTGTSNQAHGLLAVVASLQQTAQRAEGGFTPSLSLAVDALLTQLASMQGLIKAHHSAIQEELDKVFGEMDAANSRATETKHAADLADKEWVECVAEEKAALQAVEAARLPLNVSTPKMIQKCEAMVIASQFSEDLVNTSLTCDQRKHKCSDLYFKWQKGITKSSERIKSAINQSILHFKDAKRECENATEVVADERRVLRDLAGHWSANRTQCRLLDGERQKDICAYGMRLQEKCSAEATYEELLSNIAGTNTTYSELDLEAEWNVVQTVRCMLTALKDGGKVVGMADCQNGAEPFEVAVGTLTKRAEDLHRLAHSDEAWCSRRVEPVSGPLGFVLKDASQLLGYGDSANSVELLKGQLSGSEMVEQLIDAAFFRKDGATSDSKASWLACSVEEARLMVTELEVRASRGKLRLKTVDALYRDNDGTATCSPAEVNAKVAAGDLTSTFAADSFISWGFAAVGVRYSIEGSTSVEGFLPRDYSGSEGTLLGNGSDARLVELVRGNLTERRKSGLVSLPANLYRRTAGFRASMDAERWLAVYYDHEAIRYQLKMVQLEVSAVDGWIYLSVISAHRTSIQFKDSYVSKYGKRVTTERANEIMDSGALDNVKLIKASGVNYGLAMNGLAFTLQGSVTEKALEGFVARGCSVGSRLLSQGVDARSAQLKEVSLGGKEIGSKPQVATAVFKRTGQHSESAVRWLACLVDRQYSSLKMAEVEVRSVAGSLYTRVLGAKVKADFSGVLSQQTANEAMDHVEAMNVNVATWEGQGGVGVVALHASLNMREYRHSITFSDQGWSFPRSNNSEEATSAAYLHSEPWAEEFNYTANAPFELCKPHVAA